MADFTRALVWLRRDLRLSDHRALFEACAASKEVVPVFVYDTTILTSLDRDDRRVTFIHDALEEMDSILAKSGRGLVTAIGDPAEIIPQLVHEWGAEAVFCSHDDDPYALERDKTVAASVGKAVFVSVKDHLIFERREILNGAGEPFRVYTPYARAWRANFVEERDAAEFTPDLSRVAERSARCGNRSFEEIGFSPHPPQFEAGEEAAQKQLAEFLEKVSDYPEQRNFPADDETSGLSPALRFGTISIRECVRAVLKHQSAGADKWLGELIWREFYHMILACFPHVARGHSFNLAYDAIRWPGTEAHFAAWCEGRTGYPLVDAAMRCFNATGWMHNRNRMIVASFLVKDLLVDWRQGEAYFARHLLDFELSSNNGNWQWAAGTGVDAQPYFRIFNPVLQSRKFDAQGRFIRRWCPELSEFDNKVIHEPWLASDMDQIAAGCRIGEDYPSPIVDHATQKPLALALFKNISQPD